jgi:hypothetical protein
LNRHSSSNKLKLLNLRGRLPVLLRHCEVFNTASKGHCKKHSALMGVKNE